MDKLSTSSISRLGRTGWSLQESRLANYIYFHRVLNMPDKVGAVIPVEGSDKLVALVGTKICLVDRETGAVLYAKSVWYSPRCDRLY